MVFEENMSVHKFKMLNLYKRVLVAHQALPVDLRHFGDVYAKVEFRQHKKANEKFIPQFVAQWTEYCENLEADAREGKFGPPIRVVLAKIFVES